MSGGNGPFKAAIFLLGRKTVNGRLGIGGPLPDNLRFLCPGLNGEIVNLKTLRVALTA